MGKTYEQNKVGVDEEIFEREIFER